MRGMLFLVVLAMGCDDDGEPIAEVTCKHVECDGPTAVSPGELRGGGRVVECWWNCDDAEVERFARWERDEDGCFVLVDVTIEQC